MKTKNFFIDDKKEWLRQQPFPCILLMFWDTILRLVFSYDYFGCDPKVLYHLPRVAGCFLWILGDFRRKTINCFSLVKQS